MLKNWLPFLLGLGVIGVAYYLFITEEVEPQRPAVEFRAQTLAGDELQLSKLRGKVVILNFWATWCGPCVALIPKEKEQFENWIGKPVVFIGISADESEATLRQFVQANQIPWPVVFDGRSNGPIANQYKVNAFPTTILIDAKGKIRFRYVGGKSIESAVETLLDEAARDRRKPQS